MHKHAPMEISSKKMVKRHRDALTDVTTFKARDPRFESLSGNYDDKKVTK